MGTLEKHLPEPEFERPRRLNRFEIERLAREGQRVAAEVRQAAAEVAQRHGHSVPRPLWRQEVRRALERQRAERQSREAS